ncbi:MAG: SGNH/GDSL hydrolase family protein [Candidatus Omnitrophica bacterium]|nr:SGNH/GDSL hydrolase family protein [Candidatus Omnitrophota bacterium]
MTENETAPNPIDSRKRLFQILALAWILFVALTIHLEHRYEMSRPEPDWISAHRKAVESGIFYFLVIPTAFGLSTVWKKNWKEIVLLVGSITIALLVGQGLVMIFYPDLNKPHLQAVRERTYHHIYPANATFHENFADRIDMTIHTNSDGLRTSYEPATFRKHSTRIAILGDSFMFGLGVEPEETVSMVLEKLLNEKSDRDVAVLNCGVISYSPFLESILFDGVVKKYHPTHTLLFLDATDFGDDTRYLKDASVIDDKIVFEKGGNKPFEYWGFVVETFLKPTIYDPLATPWKWALRKAGLMEEPVDLSLYKTVVTIDGKPHYNRFFHYNFPMEKTRPYFEQTYGYIEEIAKKAEAIGSKFALIVTPRYHHWNNEECPDNWEKHQYRVDEPYEYEYLKFFDEKAKDAPFPILNLLPAFQATDRFPLVFSYDPHWNAEGHHFVAEQTYDFLKDTYFSEN